MKGIICGKGGQGVITLNRMIGEIYTLMGKRVVSAETHGMAMRGGSVNTFIKIGNYFTANFGIGEADFLISTDINEYFLYKDFLKDDGIAFVNGNDDSLKAYQEKVITIPATMMSIKCFNTPKFTNFFLLISFLRFFQREKLFDETVLMMKENRLIKSDILDTILKETQNVE